MQQGAAAWAVCHRGAVRTHAPACVKSLFSPDYMSRVGCAQNFPNGINEPAFPACILHPGGIYRTRTEWRFYDLPDHGIER